jgi:hypothetical protein
MGLMRDAFDGYLPVLALSAGLDLIAVLALVLGHRLALRPVASFARNP